MLFRWEERLVTVMVIPQGFFGEDGTSIISEWTMALVSTECRSHAYRTLKRQN